MKRGYDVVGADYTLFMSMINMFFYSKLFKGRFREEELKVHSTLDLLVNLVIQKLATKSREITKSTFFYYLSFIFVSIYKATKSR